jgi:micrococcal nuclease
MRRGSLLLLSIVVLAGCLGSPAAEGPSSSPSTTVSPSSSSTASAPGTNSTTTNRTVTITDVVDGDTMEIRYPDGRTDTIRLLGVDTPETNGGVSPAEFEGVPDTAAGRAWLSEWADRATAFARSELAGATVQIATDPVADRRGGFDRLLVYLYVDGRNFNQQLLDRGFARLYDTRFSEREAFLAAERHAQAAHAGLWGYTTATASSEDDRTVGGLAVATVQADAAGNDHENPNGEYLVFENAGTTSLDVGGWTVSDDAGNTYRFPRGTALPPGETITLYTGSGTDTAAELYWGSERAIWNNGGDTITVREETGDVVLEYTYD